MSLTQQDRIDFDPSAYLRDTQGLSLGAQGLWMRMLCWMNSASPRGYLVTCEGEPLTDESIAKKIGTHPKTVHALTKELKDKGIFSVDQHGRIYCRRMARERRAGEPLKSAAERIQNDPPAALLDWIGWWNRLVEAGHLIGYLTRSKPPIELCRSWIRIQKNPEVRAHLRRRTEMEASIKQSPMVKRWLTLAGLFGGKNGDGEYKVRKLLEGRYVADERTTQSNGSAVGLLETMQRFRAGGDQHARPR